MRFPPLHNTHPITIEINPSLKTSPAFIHIIRSAVIILSRSSPSSRRNLSGKIFLPLLHPLDDHLTGLVACLNRTVRSLQQQQVNQGRAGLPDH